VVVTDLRAYFTVGLLGILSNNKKDPQPNWLRAFET